MKHCFQNNSEEQRHDINCFLILMKVKMLKLASGNTPPDNIKASKSLADDLERYYIVHCPCSAESAQGTASYSIQQAVVRDRWQQPGRCCGPA